MIVQINANECRLGEVETTEPVLAHLDRQLRLVAEVERDPEIERRGDRPAHPDSRGRASALAEGGGVAP